MHRALVLLHLTTLVVADTEQVSTTSCDATDSSCHASSDAAQGKALLQHHAQGAVMMNETSIIEESRQSTKTVCHGHAQEDTWKTIPVPETTSAFTYGYTSFYSKDETPPSWMGLDCKKWCFNGWSLDKCSWGPGATQCDGCLKNHKDGNSFSGCKIPKFVSGKKNVLLLMTDDLNVDVETYEYGHKQAYTPNIKQLAESGTRFDYAYAVHPLCTPSRASFMTGILGINSVNMGKDKYWENAVMKKSRTWVEMFKVNGYYTIGTGKIGHNEKKYMFEVYGHDPNYGPEWRTNGVTKAHPTMKQPLADYGAIDLSFGRLSTAKSFITDTDGTDLSKSGWTYEHNGMLHAFCYNTDEDRDETPDEMNANFAIHHLENNPYMKHASWLMAVGIVRPHTPLHAPDKYFDHFPLEDVEVSVIDPTDNNDTHFVSGRGEEMYNLLEQSYGLEEGLKLVTQAYLASVMAADEQIGRVLDKLNEDTAVAQNTIVVMTSDHGWHNGQKQVMWKNTAWEQGTRIPLIIKHPSMQPNHVTFPVSLIDVFPTLMDLADLENKDTSLEAGSHELDGFSLKPFMEDPSYADFPRAGAISVPPVGSGTGAYTYPGGEFNGNPLAFPMAVRLKDYRYIMTNDGNEELYHNAVDPYEWTNLLYTADMKNDQTQQVKDTAIAVLNDELQGLGITLNPETEPKACGGELWVKCK